MTTENLPDNDANVSEADDKTNNDSQTAENSSEVNTHKNRKRPRRNGGRGNGKSTGGDSRKNADSTESTQQDVAEQKTSNNASGSSSATTVATNTENDDSMADDNNTAAMSSEDAAAEEAALSEGGIKTLGNQKIIDFMKVEKPMAIISGLMVLISIVAIMVNGLNLGLDFTGGISADVKYDTPVEQVEVTQALAKNGFDDAVVQYLGTRQELLVRLPPQETTNDGLSESLKEALNFDDKTAKVDNINIIGSQVGNEVYLNSMMAMAMALACMLLYVAVRFQFKLSVGAVLALFHDTVVTLGVFAILGWPFDLTVLAAILALIGYSLNDTIVVYDRIRENFRRIRGLAPRAVVNVSLTETLRRTFMTSMTVLLVVAAMMWLGGDGLFWFATTLFIGLIVGTYSSVYIASAIPLMMGMSRDDFIVIVKPEFAEEMVVFEDDFDYDDFDDIEDEFSDVSNQNMQDVAKIENNSKKA